MEITDQNSNGCADKEVLAAQIDQSFRQLPISLVVNLVNGLILIAVLWEGVEKIRLLVWLLLIIVVSAARFFSLRAFRD
ncbi:MAG: GGDEF domain-containing protein, partial [Sedimenticolaceae bacterium]